MKAVMFAVCIALAVVASNAQLDEETTKALIAQVGAEQGISRQYMDTMLKLQHSLSCIQAASYLLPDQTQQARATGGSKYEDQDFAISGNANSLTDTEGDSESTGSDSSSTDAIAMLEEEAYGYPAAPGVQQPGYPDLSSYFGAAAQQQPKLSAANRRTLFAYQLFQAIKYKTYQVIFRSADVQREFWEDRVMQLYVQAAGESASPEVLQLIFIKMYRTNLETLKLSLSFQYISQFTTWLEDELDVYGSLSEGSTAAALASMFDQEDDLIRDRMFAFSAFNSFAQIDFQTFYFDLYLDAALSGQGSFGQGSFGADGSTAAFLEEGAEAKPFTDILATGSFGAGQQVAPYMFLKVYRFYYLLFQMYTGHAGLSAAYADLSAYNMANDQDPSNDELGKQLAGQGRTLMESSFATNLMYSSQMEYVSSLYELYLIVSEAFSQNGSIGGSLSN